jgi:hypothetical protein
MDERSKSQRNLSDDSLYYSGEFIFEPQHQTIKKRYYGMLQYAQYLQFDTERHVGTVRQFFS